MHGPTQRSLLSLDKQGRTCNFSQALKRTTIGWCCSKPEPCYKACRFYDSSEVYFEVYKNVHFLLLSCVKFWCYAWGSADPLLCAQRFPFWTFSVTVLRNFFLFMSALPTANTLCQWAKFALLNLKVVFVYKVWCTGIRERSFSFLFQTNICWVFCSLDEHTK